MPEPKDPPPADSPPPAELDANAASTALPAARVVRRDRVSLVWLLPVLALATGAWLAYKTLSERGPTVTIEFRTASGISAGKTKVKFKDVDVGQVTAIDVGPDLDHVIVTAELTRDAERYLTEKTRFWVARPRVTASGVSGLETLLSGAYVAIDPVIKGKSARHFVGLAEPPVITTDEPGARFRLRSHTLGSLNLGSPVYYRHIQVGQVVQYELDADGDSVTIDIFVAEPHSRLVFTSTRFWNASGIDFRLTADGVVVDTESLVSVLLGGVAFDNPTTLESRGAPAKPDQYFPLYKNREKAEERVYLTKKRYLLYFAGSVRGLSPGAPVLLRGIPIGEVLDIELKFDPSTLDFVIPVLIEIEPERIGVVGQMTEAEVLARNPGILERLVKEGLRAQLKTGSLLTGQIYVELDFYHNAKPAELVEQDGYLVLPTVPGALDAVTNRVNAILTKVEQFPIDEIGKELTATIGSVQRIVNSSEVEGALVALKDSLTRVQALAQRLDDQVTPQLAATLSDARTAFANVNKLIGPNAPLNVEAVRTMREVSAAARSIRDIADYLERHPESLLRGKGGR